MSELRVDPQGLMTAADYVRFAHDSASLVTNIPSVTDRIAASIRGTTCGTPAADAGKRIGDLAAKNSNGLQAYETVLRDIANGYSQADQLVKAEFDRFIVAMNEE